VYNKNFNLISSLLNSKKDRKKVFLLQCRFSIAKGKLVSNLIKAVLIIQKEGFINYEVWAVGEHKKAYLDLLKLFGAFQSCPKCFKGEKII